MRTICSPAECDSNAEITIQLGPACIFANFHDGQFFRELVSTGTIEQDAPAACWQRSSNTLAILKVTTASNLEDLCTFQANEHNLVETIKLTHKVSDIAFDRILQIINSGAHMLATVTVGIESLCKCHATRDIQEAINDGVLLPSTVTTPTVRAKNNVTIEVNSFIYGFEVSHNDSSAQKHPEIRAEQLFPFATRH